MTPARFGFPVLAAAWLLSGCASPCEELADRFCGTCQAVTEAGNTAQQVSCTCVLQGTLGMADAPEDYFESDADAAMTCDEVRLDLAYVGDDEATACRVGLALLRQEGTGACEHVTIPAFTR